MASATCSTATSPRATTCSRRSSRATTRCGSSRRRSSARWSSLTGFDDEADALKIANDTLYGLGAGVWTRDGSRAFRAGREIQAGRVWTNCYHAYPAHAAFGGYKQSGIGRENHKMMLDHYQQTKNLLVCYSPGQARASSDGPSALRRASRSPVRRRTLRPPPHRGARPGDVPPVRRLLRRQLADVLPGRGVPHRRRRHAPRRPRRRTDARCRCGCRGRSSRTGSTRT